MQSYDELILSKTQFNNNFGFKPLFIPDYLFDFQKYIVEQLIIRGRSAVFADCGLGKSIIELVWADNIVKKTNKNVLLLTPLAVGTQMEKEGEKFGIECKQCKNGDIKSKIVITNYQQLEKYDYNDFVACICDESGILKSFDGKIKNSITQFMRKLEYRLLATATPSPNDYTELGTSSEALGYMGYIDMLGKFFKNNQNSIDTRNRLDKWYLKPHSELHFWRWINSWAISLRKPSDIGFSDNNFILPKLTVNDIILDLIGFKDDNYLFPKIASGLFEQRQERRATIKERCEKAADIVNSSKDYSVVWCNLNSEGDLLEKLIPDAIQISGKDNDVKKEEKLKLFSSGKVRVLVTKPIIGAWGLNWQHCNHTVFFPTHSYEQYYQAIRRFWRFGQHRDVTVDLIYTKGDIEILNNLKNKENKTIEMFDNLIKQTNRKYSEDLVKLKKDISIPKFL